jgi:hypothetical protein
MQPDFPGKNKPVPDSQETPRPTSETDDFQGYM